MTEATIEARASAPLPRLARMLVYGVTTVAAVIPLTATEGWVAAGLGAALGCLLAMEMTRRKLRAWALVGVGLCVALVSVWLRGWIVGTDLIPGAWGAETAFRAGEVVLFAGVALGLGLGLRAATVRRPTLAALEVLAVGVAFAQLVVMHRHGAINRPFQIADPIIAAGGDPQLVFIGVGAAAAAVLLALLNQETKLGRTLFHAALGLVLLVLLVVATASMGVPEAQLPSAGLGLGGDGDAERDSERSGGGSGGRPPPIEFQDNYESPPQPYPVGVVIFRDDYTPPRGTYYLRQTAFSQLNGRRLVSAAQAGVDLDIAEGFPTRDTPVRSPPPLNAFRREVRTTVALLAEHQRPFALESPVRFTPADNPDPSRFLVMYDVLSAAMDADYFGVLGARAGDSAWSEETRALYTSAPDDPRYAELAEQILREKLPERLRQDDAARALAITEWLGERGIYSLRSSHASADDPTAHFLFGDRTGYCVHFSHAATYLLRSVGIPARVATGYAIPEEARQGGSALLVTGQSSHAWPEVYFEGRGWVVFDVYPQQSLDEAPPQPDPDLQRLLGELARGQSTAPEDAGQDLRSLWESLVGFLGVAGWGTLWALLLALVVAVLIKVQRRLAPRFAQGQALPTLLYRAELDRLSDVGVRRARGETPEAFARRLAAALPSFATLTDAHVGVVHGSRSVARRAVETPDLLREVAARASAERSAAYPLWRRLVGALIPWTWLQTR